LGTQGSGCGVVADVLLSQMVHEQLCDGVQLFMLARREYRRTAPGHLVNALKPGNDATCITGRIRYRIELEKVGQHIMRGLRGLLPVLSTSRQTLSTGAACDMCINDGTFCGIVEKMACLEPPCALNGTAAGHFRQARIHASAAVCECALPIERVLAQPRAEISFNSSTPHLRMGELSRPVRFLEEFFNVQHIGDDRLAERLPFGLRKPRCAPGPDRHQSRKEGSMGCGFSNEVVAVMKSAQLREEWVARPA